jgi:hypothetical protein
MNRAATQIGHCRMNRDILMIAPIRVPSTDRSRPNQPGYPHHHRAATAFRQKPNNGMPHAAPVLRFDRRDNAHDLPHIQG